jgi:beta-lactamase class A
LIVQSTHRRRVVVVVGAAAAVLFLGFGPINLVGRAEGRSGPPGPLATRQMTSYLATRTGNITVAVYDRITGRMYEYRPGVAQTTASIIKVDILATLLHQAIVAHAPLDDGTADLAETMIENSDDDAAQTLWDQAGGSEAVGAFDRLVGMTDTTLNPNGYWGLSTTTAADQIALLKDLAAPNALLDSPSRQYELGLMEDVEADQVWGVTGGVPSAVRVAIKDGWDPLDNGTTWQINSIGWVDGQGRDYLVAVLTNGNPTEDYGIATVEGISSVLWSSLTPPPVH